MDYCASVIIRNIPLLARPNFCMKRLSSRSIPPLCQHSEC